MSTSLHYWPDIQGRAATIRYILHHAGQKINFIGKDRQTWPIEKANLEKKNALINLPFIEYEYEPGKTYNLSQTYLIIKVLGEKYGYVGKTILEKIMVAQCEEQIRDVEFGLIFSVLFTPKEEKSKMEFALKNRIPEVLGGLEKVMTSHGQKFLCCQNLTYPDFMLFTVIEWLVKMRPTILDNLPKLSSWHSTMMADSKIVEHREFENKMPFTVQYKKMFDEMPEEMKEMMKKGMGEENYEALYANLPTVEWGTEGNMGKICD